MDEQMIADIRDAIDRNVTWQTGEVFKGNRQCVNYLEVARAAHSVIAGKVAELIEALRQIEAGAINGRVEFDRRLGARTRPTWLAVNVLEDYLAASGGTARAALAPYPERRHD